MVDTHQDSPTGHHLSPNATLPACFLLLGVSSKARAVVLGPLQSRQSPPCPEIVDQRESE